MLQAARASYILTMAGLSEFLFSLLQVDAGTDKMSFSLRI